MEEILDFARLKVLIHEIFWHAIPRSKNIPFQGDLVNDLGLDSLDILDLAAEFHFRFDMLSGNQEAYLLQYKNAADWLNQIHKSANDPTKRFGFFSSGSSGKPKQIWHQKERLLEERDYWIGLTKAKGIISLVPVRHIYGFIWSLLMGSKLKRAQFLSVHEWHRLPELSDKDDLIVGHPISWQQIAPPFKHLLAISSTAPIDKDLTARLRLNGVQGINIYGSTETAAIAFEKWENDYFELLPYWRLEDVKGQLLRGEEPYTIPDHLDWLNQNHFRIKGRIDKVIQIGGENVSLMEVKERLKAIEGVKQVWVKPYESSWGTRLFSYFQIEETQDINSFETNLLNHFKNIPAKLKPRKWRIGHLPYNKLDI